ncbi:MAG TPA: MarR family transcriptional regulator [Solirubrobacteraceae bacterium]|nr:MarR family transcriptional regulator [Solirubrobacteraceae bacterium]
MQPDRIQVLVAQWRQERPDLDVEAMTLVARILTVAALVSQRVESLAKDHQMTSAEGDVLFTLRRSGAPYTLSPTTLAKSLLVSSGTMTNRLDRLERRALIERKANPRDRRAVDILLTREGLDLVDEAITEHVTREVEMLSGLTSTERTRLDAILRKLGSQLQAD